LEDVRPGPRMCFDIFPQNNLKSSHGSIISGGAQRSKVDAALEDPSVFSSFFLS
jgi:hypothetical protein